MNATMIANREYVDTMIHFNSKVTKELIETAEILFKKPLTKDQTREIHNMDLFDKQWLLKEWKEDIKECPPADLDNIY